MLANLKSVILRCSGLADECLFFLRREVHVHCFYYLTQLRASDTFENEEKNSPIFFKPDDCVLAFNANLASMERRLHLYLSKDKMSFLFDGLDALAANIVTTALQKMTKISKSGVRQIHCNLTALQQNLTTLFYGYPLISRDFFHFERAKRYTYIYIYICICIYMYIWIRYYQLLLLSETELELYLMENRKAYPPENLKAIWRVDVPGRLFNKSTINKLDSLLR